MEREGPGNNYSMLAFVPTSSNLPSVYLFTKCKKKERKALTTKKKEIIIGKETK